MIDDHLFGSMYTREQLEEMIRCRSFGHVARTYWGMNVDRDWEFDPTMIRAGIAWQLAVGTSKDILIVSPNQDDAKTHIAEVLRLYEGMPEWLRHRLNRRQVHTLKSDAQVRVQSLKMSHSAMTGKCWSVLFGHHVDRFDSVQAEEWRIQSRMGSHWGAVTFQTTEERR